MRYCIFCGVEIPTDAKYCQICGKEQPENTVIATDVKVDEAGEENADETGLANILNSPQKMIAAGFGAFFIVMILTTGFMLLFL